MTQFVHLHLHSEYSLVDGLPRVKPLVGAVKDAGMPAVALTDQSNMFALVRFYKAAQGAGLKPVMGSDVWVRNPEDANSPYRLVLLIQDLVGYRHLMELVSRSYREGQHLGRPLVDPSWLTREQLTGLIALSGAREGDVARALLGDRQAEAEQALARWVSLMGDRYYLELVRTGRPGEEEYLHAAVALAAARGVPVVATNDVRFLERDDFHSHEVRVCINQGRALDDPRRPKEYSEQQYLRTPEEMAELFSDLPQALQNSVQIAKRCNLELTLGKNFLPDFPIPDGMTEDAYFRQVSLEGLEDRLKTILDPTAADYAERKQPYIDRLNIELDVIIGMGFPGYFLIVADFIQWAKDNDVPVGPGRGSGAGSLVAYAMKITDLDPLALDLLFERFLNPERVSMPDFDVDFCMDNRDKVIDYVARTYGRDSVSQIITYGSMAAKAVVRDVGRVLGHPYGFVDGVAKLVPNDLGITLTEALKQSDEFRERYQRDEEVTQLIDMALSLEGLARNAGKHAGGVVIAPGKLTDLTPLYCEAGGDNLVTQYDKDDVEAIGLVKFDFLGLRNLTIIDWAVKTINAQRAKVGEEPLVIEQIPWDDKASFDLIKTGETTAVFQLESPGMKKLIRKLKPDNFDDITALVALYRPGPLQSGMVDDFVARKHGLAKVEYPHPDLEPILKPTYGVILYQEQVMQIAQVLANYSLGGADLLRRAMGKKKPEEMEKQRGIFMQGALERGVEEKTATYIFDLMEKFAGYGFNKSHSAAYALVAYQTLYLKAHYPAAYMAAVLSSDMDNTEKVFNFGIECRAMELPLSAPDVNRSSYQFTVDENGKGIIFGLGAIKGVGESAIEGIVEAREQGGRYTDLFDFCRRIDLKKANRRTMETLVRAGALDSLGVNRATLMLQLPMALRIAEQEEQSAAAGQDDLFGMGAAESAPAPTQVLPDPVREWDDDQRLHAERDVLGLFLSGHPIDRYADELPHIVSGKLGSFSMDEVQQQDRGRRGGRKVVVAGLVLSVRKRQTQRGVMATVVLDDGSGWLEMNLFNEAVELHEDILVADRVIVVQGQLIYDEYRDGIGLRSDRLYAIEDWRAAQVGRLRIRVPSEQASPELADKLLETLKPYRPGRTLVEIDYANRSAAGLVHLPEAWAVRPEDGLLQQLREQFGDDALTLDYRSRPVPSRDDESVAV